MAPSFYLSFLLSLMLAILLICPTHSQQEMHLSEQLLNDICSNHKRSPVCSKALINSDSITPVQVIGLTRISINQAAAAANTTLKLLAMLKSQTMVPSYVANYEDCREIYGQIVNKIEEARKALKAGAYERVFVDAGVILTYNDDCSDELGSSYLKESKKAFTALLRVSKRLTRDG